MSDQRRGKCCQSLVSCLFSLSSLNITDSNQGAFLLVLLVMKRFQSSIQIIEYFIYTFKFLCVLTVSQHMRCGLIERNMWPSTSWFRNLKMSRLIFSQTKWFYGEFTTYSTYIWSNLSPALYVCLVKYTLCNSLKVVKNYHLFFKQFYDFMGRCLL